MIRIKRKLNTVTEITFASLKFFLRKTKFKKNTQQLLLASPYLTFEMNKGRIHMVQKLKEKKRFGRESSGIRKGETKVVLKTQNSGVIPITPSCAKWGALDQNFT